MLAAAAIAGAILSSLSTLSAQGVVINEVYYDAPGSDNGQVFVELAGPPGTDIGGWTLQAIEGGTGANGSCNNESFTFPMGTTIDNTGFVVVADDDGTGATQVPNAHFIVPDMDLENGGDALQLIDAGMNLVDAVAYGTVDKSGGPASSCNGLAWYEGNEARDVFAPLSIERCPAGSDTNDNAIDFTPNVPTPGTGESCCTAIEWVNQGAGNSLTLANGESVGLDVFADCGANQLYLILGSFTDPTVTPPPAGLPVFDATTTTISTLANFPPFVAWAGTLSANGDLVGTAAVDFSSFTGLPAISPAVTMYIGAIAFDASGGIVATNHVDVTWN
jgi:hypothetical protein